MADNSANTNIITYHLDPSNPKFWVAAGTIAFLAFVFWRAGGAILKSLDSRGAEISKQIDEAGELLAQAESQMAAYKEKFGKADADAAAIVQQAKDEAARVTEKSAAELSSLLSRRSAAFDQRMSQLQVQAQNDLKSKAAELAIGALRKSLPEQLDAAALASLADTAIDDLPNRV